MNRFFDLDSPLMRALAAAFDWAVLSLVSLLCALPLVTAGASLCALYGTIVQPDNAGAKTFLRRFRHCLRQAVPLWLSFLAAAGLLAADVRIVEKMPPAVRAPLWGGVFFLVLCLLLSGTVLFPLAASAPGASLAALWRRALFLSIAKLPRTLAMTAAAAVPAAVFVSAPTLFFALGLFWIFVWPVLLVRTWSRLGGQYLKME